MGDSPEILVVEIICDAMYCVGKSTDMPDSKVSPSFQPIW